MTVVRGTLSIALDDLEKNQYSACSSLIISFQTKMSVRNFHDENLVLNVDETLLRKLKKEGKKHMKKYQCIPCGYIYDPVVGDPDGGIAPGTLFEDIPDDWRCPICFVGKEDFEVIKE